MAVLGEKGIVFRSNIVNLVYLLHKSNCLVAVVDIMDYVLSEKKEASKLIAHFRNRGW